MSELITIKSLGLLLLIVFGALVSIYEVFSVLPIEKRYKYFWTKVSLIGGTLFGILLWLTLIGWGEKI